MSDNHLSILAIGATGSIGRHVVRTALASAHRVRALVRDAGRAGLPGNVEVVEGELTRPETLAPALDGIDAIVFTHGSHGGSDMAEAVDYGGVRNVLQALDGRPARIALMTTIGVTDRKGAHDWKRRGERLVRASGLPYTIVRPGWFDYNKASEKRLVLLQGDTRQSGTPRDGAVARSQLAAVLVHALTTPTAINKTFELVAENGLETADFGQLFATVAADEVGALDAIRDAANMPLDAEPAAIRQALDLVRHASPSPRL